MRPLARWRRGAGIGALLVALLAPGSARPAGPDEPCRRIEAGGEAFTICTVDLRQTRIRLFLRDAEGEPYGSFSRLVRAPEGQRVVFAMNGGMYHADRSPVGLYVEDGREMKRANTANGPGNFHLKPNGVFYVAGDRGGVLETGRYLKQKVRADYATQSGPMLVVDGKLHPRISEEGTSRKVRNGVGLRDPHTVLFAISDGPVTFAAFAHLFRDTLGCRNALFLDGSISGLHAPNLGRSDSWRPMGPIIAAFPR